MVSAALKLKENPFRKSLVIVVADSETSFRIIQKTLGDREDVELRWHSETIEALADIFMEKPELFIVFKDKNEDSLAFFQLVRNRPANKELPGFIVFPEPERFWVKWNKRLNITERFTTPVDHARLRKRAQELLKLKI